MQYIYTKAGLQILFITATFPPQCQLVWHYQSFCAKKVLLFHSQMRQLSTITSLSIYVVLSLSQLLAPYIGHWIMPVNLFGLKSNCLTVLQFLHMPSTLSNSFLFDSVPISEKLSVKQRVKSVISLHEM